MLDTLSDVTVTGLGDETLVGSVLGPGDGTLSGGDVVRYMLGRDVAIILFRVLMAYICLSPTANRDSGAGFLSNSIKSSNDW